MKAISAIAKYGSVHVREQFARACQLVGGEPTLALLFRRSHAYKVSDQLSILRMLDSGELDFRALLSDTQPPGRPALPASKSPAPANVVRLPAALSTPAPTPKPAPAPPPKPAAPPKPEAKGRDRFLAATPAVIDPGDPKLHRLSRSALLTKTQVAFGTAVDPNSTIFQLETLWLQRGHAIPWNSRLEPNARVLASFTAAQKVAHTAEAERILELFQNPSKQNL